MLRPIDPTGYLRIASIDPGSNSAGFSVLDYDIETGHIHVVESRTVFGKDLIKLFGPLREKHEERFLRNMAFGDFLEEFLNEWEPFIVCSEAPYMGRFAAAFKALTEQITLLRAAVYRYDLTKPFYLYEPSPVKRTMGVKGTSGDKEAMRKALSKRTDVSYGSGISIDDLDEHSIDSICVGIHQIKRLKLYEYKSKPIR